jgi:hypothetical protein
MMRTIKTILALLLLAAPAAAERYWIGPVQAIAATANEPAHYGPPAGVTSWIDLRTPAECGAAPTAANGVAIFVTADGANLGASYTNLGTDPERQLTPAQRASLGTALRLPSAPNSTALADCFYEALTTKADPTGAARAKPIIPTGDLRLELHLGGRKLRDRAFDAGSAEAAVIQQQLRAEYRTARQAVQAGQLPANFHRKILGGWVQKYKLSYRWFQPADVPDESDIPPSTTYTESFPTNSSTLSSGQDQPWTEVFGDAQVLSGALTEVSGNPHVRCNTVLSSSDNYAQGVVVNANTVNSRAVGPACRYSSSADTAYGAVQYASNVSPTYRIIKMVAGVKVDLGTGTTQTAGATKKVYASGTTIKAYQNGSEVESITDTAISTGTDAGVTFWNSNTTTTLDNFEAGDLAETTNAAFPQIILSQRRNKMKKPLPCTYYFISP